MGARAAPTGQLAHTGATLCTLPPLTHALCFISPGSGDPTHQVTCRWSQESRLLLRGHTEPSIAATDLWEAGQAPDTKQWSCQMQVCPLPCRRAGLAPAQSCDRAGTCEVVVHMPLHCLPCPAQAPVFGLRPRRPLLVLPKLGCPLLHCPSCSPAWFPHIESHPHPASAPWGKEVGLCAP